MLIITAVVENGYGISIGGSSTDCLVENNIFESLRHSMIISTGANGNVFGYNASFNKPDGNWDEASISIHGHYAYLNLFEGNYAEFANEDFVWGQNGPFNTFFRNYIYHEGYVFNLIHNQELLIEEGNDSTNVVANLADVTALGNGDYLEANYIFESLHENQFYNEFSYYNSSRPNFLSTEYSWPCFGLPPDESIAVNDSIPAVTRFYSTVKTVPGPEMLITKVNREGVIFPKTILLQNYPNPFNPETTISFILAVSAFVTLKIYDILGREIATLVNAEKTSGYFQVKFDTYSIGDGLSSGIYFYTLIAGDLKISKKMVLLR